MAESSFIDKDESISSDDKSISDDEPISLSDDDESVSISSDDESWADDDLDGITDELVIQTYKLAQQYYTTSTYGMDTMFLNDLMTRIAEDKPTFDKLCSNNCNVLGIWIDIFENMGDTSTVVIEMKKRINFES